MTAHHTQDIMPTDSPEGIAYLLRTDDGRFIEEFIEFNHKPALIRLMIVNQAREARVKNVVIAGQVICKGDLPPLEAAGQFNMPGLKHEGAKPALRSRLLRYGKTALQSIGSMLLILIVLDLLGRAF